MQRARLETPADFTFMHMGLLRETRPENVQNGRVGAPRRGHTNKLATRAIWLNNNCLQTFRHLDAFAASILETPAALTWLDLSFNHLTTIDSCILEFPALRIIYLHGNRIDDARELVKLQALSALRALTLHGNPIYTRKQYRAFTIALLPQIVSLDFTRITLPEREYATAIKFDIE